MMTRIVLRLGATVVGILTLLSLATFVGIVLGLTLLAAGVYGSLALAAGLCATAVTAGSLALAAQNCSRSVTIVPGAITVGAMILTAQAIVPAVW
jgi:hypothetical protein